MNDTVCIQAWWLWLAGGMVVLWMFLKVAFPWRLWIEAMSTGAPVRAGQLLGMRLRKVDPKAIVRPYIAARKSGVPVDLTEMEVLHLAGGNVREAVNAVIRANEAGETLPWAEVAEQQLDTRSDIEVD